MPTPEPSPKLSERYNSSSQSHRRKHRVYPRVNSDLSLSTISEEPTQYSSHEIIVQPEVVVETVTLPGSVHGSSSHLAQLPHWSSGGHLGPASPTSSMYSSDENVSLLDFYFIFAKHLLPLFSFEKLYWGILLQTFNSSHLISALNLGH